MAAACAITAGWIRTFGQVTAVVTGSARRIGREIALELARRGAHVMVHSRGDRASADETAAQVRSLGVRAEVCLADLTTEEGARQLMEAAGEALGGIDILVNSAAIRRAVPFADLDLKEWREIMAIILDGTYLCCREAVKAFGDGNGRIVNVAARQSLEPRLGKFTTAYTASKAGVAALTQALAAEVAPRILVNAVAPSIIDTPANRAAMPDADFSQWPKVDDIAASIVFLASTANRLGSGAITPIYGAA